MIFLTEMDGSGYGYMQGYTDLMALRSLIDDRDGFCWGYACGDGDHYGDLEGGGEQDHMSRALSRGDGDYIYHSALDPF